MKEKIKKLLTENAGYKILALFIAFFLWFYVIGEKVAERVYRLPVVFQNISGELIVQPRTPKIYLSLKGTRSVVMNYNPENFSIIKDLKNYTPGKYAIPVSLEDIPLENKNMEIVKIEPNLIDIEIKVREEKIVKFGNVPIKILETPASFFRVNLTPGEVNLKLMKTEEYASQVDISQIMVFLDISELKEGVYQLPLQVRMPQGIKLIKIEPDVVKIILETL